VLLVLGVALKTAQIPAHGWLIQVMEAPTPVSALLHAGVVNLGGFVLIRLGFLLDAVPMAQWLLVGLGSATALLAGLSMLTRVSIKVRLAWSTCAQMGFMLVECGLGLYTLALAHIVGHSLYKAYAFLRAGSMVQETLVARMVLSTPARVSPWRWVSPIGSALTCWGLARLANEQAAQWLGAAPLPAAWLVVLALAFAPALWVTQPGDWRELPRSALDLAGLFAALLLCHLALIHAGLRDGATRSLALQVAPVTALAVLYATQAVLAHGARPRWLQAIGTKAYAGFGLDDWATRLAWRLWPANLPQPTRTVPAARTIAQPFGERI
ncbi:proton-conducting transporter transmembrane domain-containing protein, partial [Thiomonas sp.]